MGQGLLAARSLRSLDTRRLFTLPTMAKQKVLPFGKNLQVGLFAKRWRFHSRKSRVEDPVAVCGGWNVCGPSAWVCGKYSFSLSYSSGYPARKESVTVQFPMIMHIPFLRYLSLNAYSLSTWVVTRKQEFRTLAGFQWSTIEGGGWRVKVKWTTHVWDKCLTSVSRPDNFQPNRHVAQGESTTLTR